MCQYASVLLNIIEYTYIYLKTQSAEYARILNMSDVVHSIRSMYKLLSSYRDRDVFRTLSNIEDGAFCKKNIPECRCAIRNVSWKGVGEWEGVVDLEELDKKVVKNNRKRDPARKHFEVSSARYS